MPEGKAFGDLSILYGKERAATCIAAESTLLAVLTKKDYENILAAHAIAKKNELVKFLRSFEFFNHMSKQALLKIYENFEKKVYHRGNTVYKEGDRPNGIWLVTSGEFEMIKHVKED